MNIQDFLGIGIVGVALSFLIQYIKGKMSATPTGAKALTLLLAFAVGTGYYFLSHTSYWPTVLTILATSTIVWAFFLNNGSNNPPSGSSGFSG